MDNDSTSNYEHLQAEIVVIGGGGGGLAAAVSASEAGAKNIILLEKMPAPGGNAVRPVGIFGIETPLQKRLCIDARKEVFFKEAMNYTHWKTDPRLVRVLVDKSTDTIQWLERKGIDFVQILPHWNNQTYPTFHAIKGPRRTGTAIVKSLAKKCEDLGVRILCQTAANKILVNEKGEVSGVLAISNDKKLSINAQAVIIATGGFAGNDALLKEYLPTYNGNEIHIGGMRHNGDGTLMATEIGAAMEGMITLEMQGPDFPASPHLSVVAKRPQTIWVNKNGQRFIDEAHYSPFETANALYRQPGKSSYSLFDERIKQIIMEEGLSPIEEFMLGSRTWHVKMNASLQSQTAKGMVKISKSWSEIAKWMKILPNVMEDTIEEYNNCCKRGLDDVFAKDRRYLVPLNTPPYYAVKCCLCLLATHGGVKINQYMEVLNQQDTPIRGLYAAGVETGGTDSDTYNVVLTGHSLCFTVSSGRIAGENAARYLTHNK